VRKVQGGQHRLVRVGVGVRVRVRVRVMAASIAIAPPIEWPVSTRPSPPRVRVRV